MIPGKDLELLHGSGSILVIRDSFSSCLGGFLEESFENMILVNLRYFRRAASELMTEKPIDQVLIDAVSAIS